MGKLLLLVLLAFVVYAFLRASSAKSKAAKGRQAPGRPAPGTAVERMVRCERCGVHLPIGEAVLVEGRHFCSPEHARGERD